MTDRGKEILVEFQTHYNKALTDFEKETKEVAKELNACVKAFRENDGNNPDDVWEDEEVLFYNKLLNEMEDCLYELGRGSMQDFLDE